MSVIDLDATGWNSVADFHRATMAAVGGQDDTPPATMEELLEYLVLESTGNQGAYVIRISNAHTLPLDVRLHIQFFASQLKHAQGGYLGGGLEDIGLEIIAPETP